MWILILSIVSDGNSAGGPSVSISPPAFQTYTACSKAGELAIKQHGGERAYEYADVRWSCVKDR